MKSFAILGLSSGFVSMVINVLLKRYGKDLDIQIIKNIIREENIQYQIDGPLYEEIFHDKWVIDSRKLFIGASRPKTKKLLFDFFFDNYSLDVAKYCNIIHPSSDIAENVTIGLGSFFGHGATIGPFSEIGDFVTFQRLIGVGHHTKISDFCTIYPGVNIAGFSEIAQGTTIGMGSNIINGVKIGRNVIIGAGSLVNKDIPDNVVAYGVPAKIIRKND